MKKIIILFFLFSCSANYHAKIAIKKGLPIIKSDTVIYYDTIYKSYPKVVLQNKWNYDTVFISKDSVIIETKFFKKDSIIQITVDCPDCPQITKTETIKTEYLVDKKKSIFAKIWIWFKINFWLLTIIALILLALKLIKK